MKYTTKKNNAQLNSRFSSEEIIASGKKDFEFPNNEAGFEGAKAWMLSIRDKSQLEKIIVGMEPTGHY